ncbi:hypothetical protein HRI_004272700 [Hibiscus trionum]|uniref:RING-type E3 ubiquitin transferase n=1 Tax=Hibiscus trionum TaxID=183268 RepID=A0A9W7J0S5_HIBTR|nr:hypothetical protein HRI_004272700 [Hibiscus trionum]
MGSIGNPRTWVPYTNAKDCSQGFCSVYCPQWCYIYPPPPPVDFTADNDSGPNFSPLVIAIIGILASAFLLVSYYTIISSYCGNVDSTSRRENDHETDEVMEDDHNSSVHEPWQISSTGLDEALIKSITAFKYKKGDGLVDGTDCSVCLNEFQDEESLRLLPTCSHAFHLPCIDTWLRSHSNCPLCRANIVFVTASAAPPLPSPVTETPPVTNENLADAMIHIREEYYLQQMRRSISMDHFCQTQVSVADQEGDSRVEECHFSLGIAGSSKQSAETSKVSSRMSVLQCVMNPAAMKRSFSSGRLFLARQGRVRDLSIPL